MTCSTPSTHPILLGRPSLPSIRSLDIGRYLSVTPPERISPPPLPLATPQCDLPLVSMKSASPIPMSIREDDEDEEEVIVLPSKRSSRVGMKLNSRACVPCKKQHTVCSHVRPCPRCCNKGIEHLCVDAPSRRGKKPRPVDSDGSPLKRPPLHRIPSRSTSTKSISTVTPPSRSLSKSHRVTSSAPVPPRRITKKDTGTISPSPSTSPSAQTTTSSYSSVSPPCSNTPLPMLRSRPASLSPPRYYESSESDHSTSSGSLFCPSS